MDDKREKSRKRLSAIEAEVLLLEREKEMVANTMIDIENAGELKKRVRLKKTPLEAPAPAAPAALTPELVKSFNQLFFEMKNLPLEYVLSQSSKIVLTAEWILSLIERKWIEKIKSIKKLTDRKTFLEEKNRTEFTEVETKRREILKKVGQAKKDGKLIEHALGRAKPAEDIFAQICAERSPDAAGEDMQSRYRSLLALFSLMKANKSTVRLNIPPSKKSVSSMHSSHTACLEKLKAEIGKIATIPELARYRQCKKSLGDTQHLHPAAKYPAPIIYSGADESLKLSADLEEEPFLSHPRGPGEKEKTGNNSNSPGGG